MRNALKKKTIYARNFFAYEGDTVGSNKFVAVIGELEGGESDHKLVKTITVKPIDESKGGVTGGKRRTRRRRRTRRKSRKGRKTRRRRSTRRKR